MIVICSPLSDYSGTVELTLPSLKSAQSGRVRRILIAKNCCVLLQEAAEMLTPRQAAGLGTTPTPTVRPRPRAVCRLRGD